MRLFPKKKTAEQRIIEASQKWVEEYIEQRLDEKVSLRTYGSPIERIFIVALASTVRFGFTEFEVVHEEKPVGTSGLSDRTIFVESQARLLDWPVDFAVSLRDPFSGRVKTIAIECDGHDFHERTKEQAAKDRGRDRALQAAGYTVFRFTGSELWRNPIKCAEQVIEVLADIFDGFVHDYLDRGTRR